MCALKSICIKTVLATVDKEATKRSVWHSLENPIPDYGDGLIHWSDEITVEIDNAGCRRLESSHPVSSGSVRREMQATGSTVFSVHL